MELSEIRKNDLNCTRREGAFEVIGQVGNAVMISYYEKGRSNSYHLVYLTVNSLSANSIIIIRLFEYSIVALTRLRMSCPSP